MFKLLLKKTVFRGADKESQERLLKLLSKKFTIIFLSIMIWLVLFASQFILPIIIDIMEKGEFATKTQVVVSIYAIASLIFALVFIKIFKEQAMTFSLLIGNQVYFWLCTQKGNAISKKDFLKIKNDQEDLLYSIQTGACKGFCYSVCFKLLKTLEKGSIEFLAVREISFEDDEEAKNGYTLHVLYVNNGWAFDTYSVRQYPVEKFYKLEEAKLCRTYKFQDIKDLSYDEFWESNYKDVSEWCQKNDCSETWSQKNEIEHEQEVA